jgi:hypothetical protein
VKPLAERGEFWPYTKAEATKIRDYFNPASRSALNIAINAASDFVDLHDPDRKKPNVRGQVERLGAAVTELRRALSDFSSPAEDHLGRHCQAGVDEPIAVDRLRAILHQFATENRRGFDDPPSKTKAGPKEQLLEKSLICEFQKAFAVGGGVDNAKAGWPKFRKLCRDPLTRMHHPFSGRPLLRDLDDKSLQEKTRRRNRPKKRGK